MYGKLPDIASLKSFQRRCRTKAERRGEFSANGKQMQANTQVRHICLTLHNHQNPRRMGRNRLVGADRCVRPPFAFARHSGLEPESIFIRRWNRPPPSIPPRGYRVQASRGDEVVAVPSGEKSKWIPSNPPFPVGSDTGMTAKPPLRNRNFPPHCVYDP